MDGKYTRLKLKLLLWVVLGALAAALVPIAMSYLWYRKKPAGTP